MSIYILLVNFILISYNFILNSLNNSDQIKKIKYINSHFYLCDFIYINNIIKHKTGKYGYILIII